jgi:hypothetical protein
MQLIEFEMTTYRFTAYQAALQTLESSHAIGNQETCRRNDRNRGNRSYGSSRFIKVYKNAHIAVSGLRLQKLEYISSRGRVRLQYGSITGDGFFIRLLE